MRSSPGFSLPLLHLRDHVLEDAARRTARAAPGSVRPSSRKPRTQPVNVSAMSLRHPEHAGDDARRDLLRVVGGAVRAPVVDEPSISSRHSSRVSSSYFATDVTEKGGRISLRAHVCTGGSDVIGGAPTLYCWTSSCSSSELSAPGRSRSRGAGIIGRHEHVARRVVCDVLRDVEEILVPRGHERPAPALRVRDRALPADLVPDRERIFDVVLREDVVVGVQSLTLPVGVVSVVMSLSFPAARVKALLPQALSLSR